MVPPWERANPLQFAGSYCKNRMGPPWGLTTYDLLDAPNNLYALPKAASNTLTKFHYNPMSISEVIAEKQSGTPWELTPYDLLDVSHNFHVLSKTASNTCTKFH